MSTLGTYDRDLLVTIDGASFGRTAPGSFVRHIHDRSSFGTVIAYNPHPSSAQVTVLWAIAPFELGIQVQDIKPTLRALTVKWSVQRDEDVKALGSMSRIGSNPTEYIVEEEYDIRDLDERTLKELRAISEDVTLHDNGHITVKRRSHGEPPDRW